MPLNTAGAGSGAVAPAGPPPADIPVVNQVDALRIQSSISSSLGAINQAVSEFASADAADSTGSAASVLAATTAANGRRAAVQAVENLLSAASLTTVRTAKENAEKALAISSATSRKTVNDVVATLAGPLATVASLAISSKDSWGRLMARKSLFAVLSVLLSKIVEPLLVAVDDRVKSHLLVVLPVPGRPQGPHHRKGGPDHPHAVLQQADGERAALSLRIPRPRV
jgi:hypothetical protein